MQKSIFIIFFFVGTLFAIAQDTVSALDYRPTQDIAKNNLLRPKSAVIAAIGTAVANADLSGAKFDLNMQIGYKRYVGSNLNISFTYNKFNIVFEDIYNEGFMSFDLDLEYMFFPEKKFTPYIYGGPGFHAANGFENSETKLQFGLGMEYLVSDNLGVKIYADRNFLSNDILDALEAGQGNDVYYKIGFGVNFYFSKSGNKKIKKGEPTFRENNKLDDY